jgi:OOP family OmpA-OmpF porin
MARISSARSRARGLVAAASGIATLALASGGNAQERLDTIARPDTGADTHLFRPPVDSKGFLSVNGAEVLGHLDFSVGLFLDYANGLMPVAAPAEGAGEFLLDHSLQGTLQANVGIANWLVVGLSAPVVLGGHQGLVGLAPIGGAPYDAKESFAQGLGWIAAHAKARILRPNEDSPLGVAAIVQAGAGTGGAENLIGEQGGFVWPQAVLELRALEGDPLRFGLNGGFRASFGGTPATFGTLESGAPVLQHGVFEAAQLGTASFATSYRVFPPLDLVAETYATFLVGGQSDAKQRLSAEAIGGLKLFVDGQSFLMIGGGAGYTPGFQAARARGTIAFVFEPSIGDRDGDGFRDDEDQCPDQPEDFDGFEDTRADSPQGQLGCPDPDNDQDGILDVDDACVNTPEDKDGDHDTDGCPEVNDRDRDGDRILDSQDDCPDDPEDFDGFEDTRADSPKGRYGCPDPDNDQDGLLDVDEACDNNPEDKDGYEDGDGCPEPNPEPPKKVVISGNDIVILEKVQFETNSARILPVSDGILDAVASTLREHPEFLLLEVQGHADERGDDKLNLNLTTRRAKSVVDALLKRKVEKSRLRSQGYGEFCPLDSASNDAAWEKNRRVEFKIVKTSEGPTGAVLGCDAAAAAGIKPEPTP